ncbi:MAG: DUF4126 domain-containing protein [Longimicrobiales bacterium]
MPAGLLFRLTPVIALALATGLNLYATVALLGIGSRLGLLATLPPELRGLEHPIVIGAALLLFVGEAIAERIPFVDSVWSASHAIIKPIAAAILVVSIAEPGDDAATAAIAVGAALLALAVHGGRSVVSASIDRARDPATELGLHLVQAGAAAGMLIGMEEDRSLTLALAALVLLWTLALGPRSWRALVLTLYAQVGRIRAIFGRSRWREFTDLPPDLRPLLPPQPLASAPPRGIRAGIKGLPHVGAYRTGWLVVANQANWFVYRSLFGPRRVELPRPSSLDVRHGPWLDSIDLRHPERPCTLFLLKDAPHPDLAVAELQSDNP